MKFLLACITLLLGIGVYSPTFAQDVRVYFDEVDIVNGSYANQRSPERVKCPGVEQWYQISTDHYDNFKTLVRVTNGAIIDYIPHASSTPKGSTEVMLMPADGAFAEVQKALVKIRWNNANGAEGNIYAQAYYHPYGFFFTQTTDAELPVHIGLGVPSPQTASPGACTGSSSSVTLYDVPYATQYTWYSSSPAVLINGAQSVTTTSRTATISASGTAQPGNYPIQVSSQWSRANCPTSPTLTFNFAVSNPSVSITLDDPQVIAQGTRCSPTYDFSMNQATGPTALTYKVTIQGGYQNGYVVDGYINSSNQVFFPTGLAGGQTVTLTVTASTPCGSASHTTGSYYLPARPSDCGGGISDPEAERLAAPAPPASSEPAAYPNPATNRLTLQGNGQDAEAVLFDGTGRAVLHIPVLAGTAQTDVNVELLPAGIYYLQLKQGRSVLLGQQLSITH